MLVILRRAARTWVAKLLMLLLVASFGIWGISHTIFTPGGNAVVTVGDQQVTVNDFRFAYQRQLSDMSRRFGTQLTSEQARALGVESQVYAQLAAGAALDQLSENLNLGLSEDRLAQLIADDPAFKGPNGQFDRQLFSSRLRNSGINENSYIAERSKVAVRSQLVDAVANGFTPPAVLVDALKVYREQSRSVDYLLLTNANLDPIAPPTDDVLQKWFETVKTGYRAPEYRTIAYAKLEPSDIADPASITDQQISDDYEAHKNNYLVPGSRTIEQLRFADRAAADAAAAKIAAGESFDAIVTEQGKTAADVLLGDFTRDRLPDAVLADAAFAVETDGGTTPVVEGSFGPVILRITNIKPDHTRSLDEVKDEIRTALANQAAVQDIAAVHDEFEDMRASGSSLEEVANKLKLKLRVIDQIDRRGQDAKAQDVADLPEREKLLTEVFQTEPGVEALPINVGRQGYLWFEVRNITPARDRTLDEVREQAVSAWTAEQQKTALAAKAEALRTRIAGGESLETVAAELSIAVENKTGLKRSSEDPVLGTAGIAAAFSGPLGTVAAAVGADPASQVVLKVTDVNDAATTDALDNSEAQFKAIAAAAGDDILDQMVNRLQSDYGVSINQNLAQQAIVR